MFVEVKCCSSLKCILTDHCHGAATYQTVVKKTNGQRVKHISHVFISLSLIERAVIGSKAIE